MENFHWLLALLYGPYIRVVCTGFMQRFRFRVYFYRATPCQRGISCHRVVAIHYLVKIEFKTTAELRVCCVFFLRHFLTYRFQLKSAFRPSKQNWLSSVGIFVQRAPPVSQRVQYIALT